MGNTEPKNDQEFADWLAQHPDGFVLNMDDPPKPGYLVLHRSNCRDLRGRGPYAGGTYLKQCADDKSVLTQWARQWVKGEPRECKHCTP